MKIRLVTVVWGREFAEVFLRITLRTLLAEGNCPDLSRKHDVTYTIYTSTDGAALIEATPAFVRLREHMNVRLSIFAAGEIDEDNYGSHGYFWNRELELSRQTSAALFFVIPDVLYAQGTFVRWASRLEAGAGAIFTIGPQVALETIIPELEERFPEESPFSISRDYLHDLLLRHLHPLHAAMRHDSTRRPPHPEYDLRIVPNHGLVIREIVSHPFCVDPKIYNELRHYGPRDHLDTIVCEECLALSVEPLLKRVYSFYRPWPLDEKRLSNLAVWWNHYATEACEYESAVPFDICLSDDVEWPHARRRAVAGGRFYRSQVVASGRLFSLFAELQKRRLFSAANLIAFAVYVARLRRRVCFREGATILVPSEHALAAAMGRIEALLAAGREQEFIDLIADHVVFSKADADKGGRLRYLMRKNDVELAAGEGAVFTARGLPAEPLLRDAQRVSSPFSVGPFNVMEIDRVLWRGQSLAAEMPIEFQEDAARVNTTNGYVGPGGIFVVTAWGRRSNARRLLYYAAHVPLLEPFIAILLHRIYFPRVLPLIQFEQRAIGFARRIPYGIWRRLRGIPIVGPFLRRAFYGARIGVAVLRKIRTAAYVVHRNGLKQAVHLTLVRLNPRPLSNLVDVAAPAAHHVSKEQRAVMNEIRNIRAMETVLDVMAEYEAKMASDVFKSAPLMLLKRMLHDLVMPAGDTPPVERALRALADQDPGWAEAWLELAFIYEDRGEIERALPCFANAMTGIRPDDLPSYDPHPAAVAAACRGIHMARAGNDLEARACFELCLRHNPDFKIIAIEYANVLRRLGYFDQALAYYADGMYYQETRWSIPPGPRDIARLRFPYLTGNMPGGLMPGFPPAISKDSLRKGILPRRKQG